MTQNIYANAAFFEGYSKLRRSLEGLDGAPEWASLRAMLPPLRGKRVLDLGCGFGWFCRFAHAEGAASVTGIDVSGKMLARAVAESSPAITYARVDLESLTLAPSSAELIYSSLAFHYLKNLDALMREIANALAPGGRLVFSVEHPMFTAPREPGWMAQDGQKRWPIDSYLEEGPRTTNWLAPGVIKQHRTISAYLNPLATNSLTIKHVEEWGPTDAQLAAAPLLAEERQRPTFLLIRADKP